MGTVLHQQKGSSSAYVAASFPVGADTQKFKLCSIAACAVAFNENDFPMAEIKYIIEKCFSINKAAIVQEKMDFTRYCSFSYKESVGNIL